MVDLPPPNTNRWVVRRKAAVLAAVHSGELSVAEACGRYGLSEEELLSWQRAFDAYGLPGLRATRRLPRRDRRPNRTRPRR
jgi:transposase-like protein